MGVELAQWFLEIEIACESDAVDRALAVLAEVPESPEALELRGSLLLEAKQYAEAAAMLSQRVQQGGDARTVAQLQEDLRTVRPTVLIYNCTWVCDAKCTMCSNWKRGNRGDLSQDIVNYYAGPEGTPMRDSTNVRIYDIIGGHCGGRPSHRVLG